MFLPSQLFCNVIKNTPLVSIDFLIQNEDEHILLGRRINKPALGYWFVPGGRVHKDEKIDKAIERILYDELRIVSNIDRPTFKGVFEHFYQDNYFNDDFSTHYIVLAYEIINCNEAELTLPYDQHSDYKWFSRDEIFITPEVHTYTKKYFI